MASIGIFDKMQRTDGSTYNNVLQVASTQSNAISTTLGTTNLGSMDYTIAPRSTDGTSLLTLTFQPKFSTSKIMVLTSSFDISESSNGGDDYRLAAFAGSTLLGWRSSGISAYSAAGSLNFTYGFHLHVLANSWGTDSRTVELRVSATGGSTSIYQFNNRYSSSWLASNYRMTVMEIQA